jgi:putative ABC transport system permease protein
MIMNLLSLILKSFRHYLKANLWVAVGVAISTAVLTGALIVGDSVKHSLEQAVELRLGKVSHAVVSGERFFTASLASALNDKGIEVSATLKLDAVASADGGQHKLNKINVWGIDSSFAKFCISDSFPAFEQGNSVFVSENLALRLNISPGDVFQLILKKGSLLPANAPFVSDENQSVSTRDNGVGYPKRVAIGPFESSKLTNSTI